MSCHRLIQMQLHMKTLLSTFSGLLVMTHKQLFFVTNEHFDKNNRCTKFEPDVQETALLRESFITLCVPGSKCTQIITQSIFK